MEHEAEKETLFKLLKHEDRALLAVGKHQCQVLVDKDHPPQGLPECLSDHVLIKVLPPYDEKVAKYRPKER